jgi:hypothetical protein
VDRSAGLVARQPAGRDEPGPPGAAGIDITGESGAAERFRQLISTMAAVVQPV